MNPPNNRLLSALPILLQLRPARTGNDRALLRMVLLVWSIAVPLVLPTVAQESLSLQQAIALALAQNPGLRAAEQAELGAVERFTQARAGYLPQVNYSESFHWGNNPVYVFGSLLEQHRFQASNFDLATLNRPDPLTNFSSQLTAEQVVYDGQRTRYRRRSAELGVALSREQRRQAEMELLAAVAAAYYGVVLARESQRVAEEVLGTIEADLERALAMRQAGMTTEADVLSLRVSRAQGQERLIRADNDLALAEARLNDLLGVPLTTQYSLASSLRPAAPVRLELPQAETAALQQRPEAQQARMSLALAQAESRLTQAAFLPEIRLMGTFAANRLGFAARGGTNWLAGATLRWNLFRGSADRSRLAETSYLERQRELEQQRIASALQLEVRQAYLSLQAAARRMDAGQAAIAHAEESHLITADRYEAGLASVTELLHSQNALSEAKTRYLAAVYDQRMAAVQLERAAGTLDPSSEVLQP